MKYQFGFDSAPRAAIVLLAAFIASGLGGCATTPSVAASAVADAGRPEADKARDADRKPADMIEFAKIKSGEVIIDYIPGKGYFTRLFSSAVGPKGTVYAVTPQLLIDKFKGRAFPPPVSGEPGRGNVHEAVAHDGSFNVPVKADLIWTSQNYHDVHNWTGATGVAALNKAVFDALKPGGFYVVVDHAAEPGLDDAGMNKLHRIDEALVKKEVLAAGFVLDGESKVLRNPADNHQSPVFDASVKGKTDQFVLRFRKPS